MNAIRAALLAVCLALPLLPGCSSGPPADEPSAHVWVPAASVAVVNIHRRSIFAIGPSDDEQVLVITREIEDDPRRLPATEQWVVELPMYPPLNEAIAVGTGTDFEAVAIEYVENAAEERGERNYVHFLHGRPFQAVPGRSRPGVPLRGDVIIESIGPEHVVATMNLVGDPQPRDAGVVTPPRPRLTGRYELRRVVVPAIASVQPGTRSGEPFLTREQRERNAEAPSIYSAESFAEEHEQK